MLKGLRDFFLCSREGGWCWHSRGTFQTEAMDDLWQDLCEDDPSLPRSISIPHYSSSEECSDMANTAAAENDDDTDSVIGIMLPMPDEDDDDEDCLYDDMGAKQIRTTFHAATQANSRKEYATASYDEDGFDSLLGEHVPEPRKKSPPKSFPHSIQSPPSTRPSTAGLARRLLQNRALQLKAALATASMTSSQDSSLPPAPKSSACYRGKTEKTPLRSNQSSRSRSDSLVYSVDGEEESGVLFSDSDSLEGEPCRLGALPNTSPAYYGGDKSVALYNPRTVDVIRGNNMDDSSVSSQEGYCWAAKHLSLDINQSMHRKTSSSLTEETEDTVSITSSCESV